MNAQPYKTSTDKNGKIVFEVQGEKARRND